MALLGSYVLSSGVSDGFDKRLVVLKIRKGLCAGFYKGVMEGFEDSLACK